jgi:ribosomal protein L22
MMGPGRTKTNERPGTRAQVRYVRVSAYKAREVLDLIRGKHVDEADEILEFTERDAAIVIRKVLASAVANAEHNDEQDPDELYVSACYADEGPTLKRWRPRARGRATRIRKRTCHITIIVSRMPADELEQRARPTRGRPAGPRPPGRTPPRGAAPRVAKSRREPREPHEADPRTRPRPRSRRRGRRGIEAAETTRRATRGRRRGDGRRAAEADDRRARDRRGRRGRGRRPSEPREAGVPTPTPADAEPPTPTTDDGRTT